MALFSSTRDSTLFFPKVPAQSRRHYLLAGIACALTAALAFPLSRYFDLANIVMLFLLTVVLVAWRFGRGPAVAAAFLSVALFDFFFVPPQFSFTVHDLQYLLTFAIMLTVALITGQLTAGLHLRAQEAAMREQRTHALYKMARSLAGALTIEQVSEVPRQAVREVIATDECVLLVKKNGALSCADERALPQWIDLSIARAVFDHQHSADPAALDQAMYLPLIAGGRTHGVMAISAPRVDPLFLPEHRELLQTIASLSAIALERLHYVEVANAARLQIESERLRSSLLSALSHDIRTPLTALVGLADSLALARPELPVQQRQTAEAVRDQALRMSGLVSNLLDMARLHAGDVALRKEWQPLEEVIGSSIKLLGSSLSGHDVRVRLPEDLPLLEFDAVLIERVLCNLLENAAKYSRPDSVIELSAREHDAFVDIAVRDHGPGISADTGANIFEMFVRGEKESSKPGIGLGLAICRAIVQAHRGTISATNAPDGGACFLFTLPKGDPPRVDLDEAVSATAL